MPTPWITGTWIMEYATAMRITFFVLIFFLIALWENRRPRRTLTTSKKWRWFNNLSIIAITIQLLSARRTAITVSICLSGIDCSELIWPSLPRGIRIWSLAFHNLGIIGGWHYLGFWFYPLLVIWENNLSIDDLSTCYLSQEMKNEYIFGSGS